MAVHDLIKVRFRGLLILSVLTGVLIYLLFWNSRQAGFISTSQAQSPLPAASVTKTPSISRDKSADFHINRAADFRKQGHLEFAISDLTVAIEAVSRDSASAAQEEAALLERADINLQLDNFGWAIQDCERVILLDEKNQAAFEKLAAAYEKQAERHLANMELAAAEKCLDKAILMVKDREESIASRLHVWVEKYIKNEKYTAARWAMHKARALRPGMPSPGSPNPDIEPGDVPEELDSKDPQKAIQELMWRLTVYAEDPKFFERDKLHYRLGVIYLNQGLPNLAIEHLEKTTKLKPSHFDAWIKSGYAYLDLQEPHHTLFACSKVAGLGRQDARMHLLMGRAYSEQSRFDLARRYLMEAERLDPALAPDVTKALRLVQQRQADAYLKADKCDDAIALLQQTEKVDSGAKAALADTFEKRARIRRTAGDFDGSNEDLKEADRIDPTPARKRRIALTVGRTHCERGDALLRDGDNRGAIAEYERAKTIAPSLTGRANAALIKLFQRRAAELRRAGFDAEAQRDTERANALIRQDLQEPGQKP